MRLPDIEKIANPRAGFVRMVPACMAVAGLIGFIQGTLLTAMLKDTSILYSIFIGFHGAIVGALAGGLWGAFLVALFFRKTLTNTVFYGVSAISLFIGVLSAVLIHLKLGDAEPISIFLIPVGSLFAAGLFKVFERKHPVGT